MKVTSDFRYSDSNFGEPEPVANRPETIYGIILTFTTLSWLCVAFRLYVRLKIVRAPGWDDLCVVIYLLVITAGAVAICICVEYGLGQHFLLLEQWQWKGYLQTFYIGNASYVTATAFIKEALLLQYLRVFERGFFMHRFIIFLIVFTGLWGLAYSFLAWVPCLPVWEYWVADEGAHCYAFGSPDPGPFVATYQSHTATNMALDVLVLLIPMPLFFKEGTSTSARLRLVGLLSMGILVIVLAVWRLVTIMEHQVATWPTRDPTWYGPISILLAVLEVDAAAMCASVPIFWPVLSTQWGKIFVTQEVNIVHETRYMDDEEDGLTHGGSHSRSASDTELNNKHYHDSYVLAQVDPLRAQKDGVVTSARSDSIKRGTRKWTKI